MQDTRVLDIAYGKFEFPILFECRSISDFVNKIDELREDINQANGGN